MPPGRPCRPSRPAALRGGRRPWGRRRGRGHAHEIGGIAQPEAIPVEGTLARGALADDPDQAEPVAPHGRVARDPARRGCARPKRRARGVDESQAEVAAGLADDRRLEAALDDHQASLGAFTERRRAATGSGREPPRSPRPRAPRLATPDLELPVRVGEPADDGKRLPAGGPGHTLRQVDEDPGRCRRRWSRAWAAPTRPGSAVTTPSTRTRLPVGSSRARGDGDRGPGVADGVGLGAGVGVGVGRRRRGGSRASDLGSGWGSGLGRRRRRRRRRRCRGRAWDPGRPRGRPDRRRSGDTRRRRSRCCRAGRAGPATSTCVADDGKGGDAARQDVRGAGRVPSSTVIAIPALSVVAPSTTAATTRTRRPSSGSPTPPVGDVEGGGQRRRADGHGIDGQAGGSAGRSGHRPCRLRGRPCRRAARPRRGRGQEERDAARRVLHERRRVPSSSEPSGAVRMPSTSAADPSGSARGRRSGAA